MSNALAIATVTETLYQVLTNALPSSLVNGAQVTVLRPDDAKLPVPGVNIFLYQVTPNTAWRNADLPTRNADRSLRRRPQIALDLHYLITFYGADAGFEQQRLLGSVVRALHAAPTLDPGMVQTTEGQLDSGTGKYIFQSNLSSQLDVVRFTPINFSLEEMSKLWSVFLKTDYVLSLAYVAGVVLIETDDPPPAGALPVLQARIQAVPFSLAVINTVDPQSVALATPGPTTINLLGQGLGAATGAAFVTPGETAPLAGTVAANATGDQLTATLPAGLRPGVNTVQLTQTAPTTAPPDPFPLILSQSNAVAFILLPVLVSLQPVSSPPGTLVAVISPPAGPLQQVSLVLNQLTASPPGTPPAAFVLAADAHAVETDTFSFSTGFADGSTLAAGSYLARVRVDTAESRLTSDTSGAFNGPTIDVP